MTSSGEKQPVLTVISVTYNALTELKKTFESLKHQTRQDFVWLVVDGNSNDGTQEWLSSLEYPPLRWQSEPDKSIYDAMNKAIGLFETSYCQFLNAGDYFLKDDILEQVLPVLETEQPILAYGPFVIGGVGGFPERVISNEVLHRNHLFLGRHPCHQTMFFSRRGFSEVECFDDSMKIYADWDWILTFSEKWPVKDWYFFKTPLVYYDPSGVSYSSFFKATPEFLRMMLRRGNPVELGFAFAGWSRTAIYVSTSRMIDAWKSRR